MITADPTYPLYPVSSILSSTILLSMLMTNLVRKSLNLGVTFLCCSLCLENILNGINAILWATNTDLKLYVYCDIGEPQLVLGELDWLKHVMCGSDSLGNRHLYLQADVYPRDHSPIIFNRRHPDVEWI